MIKSISSGSPYIQVSGSNGHMPYMSPGAVGAGLLRFNPNSSQIEVYDGMTWLAINNNAMVDLGMDAKEAIEWAYKKMQEEKKLKEMMEQHPGLQELNDKFEMMKVLCMEEEKQQ